MPLYCRLQQVKLRLIGKVLFTENDEDENAMSVSLALRLMNEAEGQVEQDLSPRYMAPFQTVNGGSFSQLPERPTQEIIRTLCELQSVIRILETNFGSGSVVNAEKYTRTINKRYQDIIDKRILPMVEDSYNTWKFPPLPGLMLNYFNRAADDGYKGTLIQVSDGVGAYAAEQINQPGTSYWSIGDNDWFND